MPEPWSVIFAATARHDLKRLDPPVQRRITAAIENYAATGAGDVRTLAGQREPTWRLRVGDWRVVFRRHPAEQVIQVLHITSRQDAY